jgi:hypothetical protein
MLLPVIRNYEDEQRARFDLMLESFVGRVEQRLNMLEASFAARMDAAEERFRNRLDGIEEQFEKRLLAAGERFEKRLQMAQGWAAGSSL